MTKKMETDILRRAHDDGLRERVERDCQRHPSFTLTLWDLLNEWAHDLGAARREAEGCRDSYETGGHTFSWESEAESAGPGDFIVDAEGIKHPVPAVAPPSADAPVTGTNPMPLAGTWPPFPTMVPASVTREEFDALAALYSETAAEVGTRLDALRELLLRLVAPWCDGEEWPTRKEMTRLAEKVRTK